MSELLDFQDAFVAALNKAPLALTPWLDPSPASEAGLSVYRNTIAKGCVDALAANFPTVAGMVGEDWFGAAAALFTPQAPPTSAALLDYGRDFPTWLDRFPPAQELPYLAGVAHLDRLWTEALFAADAAPLSPETFAALAPEALAATRVRLHPSVRWAGFEAGLPGLWAAARAGAEELALTEDRQGLLLVRPADRVAHRIIGPADLAFLAACRAGRPLAEAIGEAAKADGSADLQILFAALIADGVFSALDPGASS